MNKPKFYPLQDSKAPEHSWIRYLEAENDDLKKRVAELEEIQKDLQISFWILVVSILIASSIYLLK